MHRSFYVTQKHAAAIAAAEAAAAARAAGRGTGRLVRDAIVAWEDGQLIDESLQLLAAAEGVNVLEVECNRRHAWIIYRVETQEGMSRVYVAAPQIRYNLGMWPSGGARVKEQFNQAISNLKQQVRAVEERMRDAAPP